MRFAGRAAIVTGAAGGIGSATALRLAGEGCKVLAVDVKASGFPAADGIRTLVADVSAGEAPDRIVAACRSAFGRLDFLVNNAGIGGAKSALDTSDEAWDRFLDVDLRAVFRLARATIPAMSTPGGRIVNISSVFGMVGFPGSCAYGVAKAGVAQLTRQLAADYTARGILVNGIAPGVIETPLTAKRIAEDRWYGSVMIDATPTAYNGKPEDIAGVVAFLCSDDARFIAGEIITVDGGWMATRYLPAP
ncbi:MAG: SDR family oxidoreductase [Alphaproteobacteria bacterium]|nr:SDR family oxidoreductase [Alphaproteobacteria bacterium]